MPNPHPMSVGAQDVINDRLTKDIEDHETRVRLVEAAVINISGLAQSTAIKNDDIDKRVGKLEKLAWAATGAYGIMGVGLEIYRTFFHGK